MNLTCSASRTRATTAITTRAAATHALPVRQRGCVGPGHGATRSPSWAHRATLSWGSHAAPLAPTEMVSLTIRHNEK